jgi:type II secretory pathway pseudopilin PulG
MMIWNTSLIQGNSQTGVVQVGGWTKRASRRGRLSVWWVARGEGWRGAAPRFARALAPHSCMVLRVRGRRGFSLLEALVVATILAMVLGLTAGITGALNGSRGSTAAVQVAAVIDLARAKALTGQGEVVVAFATEAVLAAGVAYRAVVICQATASSGAVAGETEPPSGSGLVFKPVSGWYYLPQGYVFAKAEPFAGTAGVNVLNVANARLRVRLPGPGGEERELPCIAFRQLGDVAVPKDTQGRPVLVALAEGEARDGQPVGFQGKAHPPEACRWLAVQKSSGNCMILP